jgi:hypothetical protein
MFVELSAMAQTQYANLAQAARQHDLQRSLADLPGGFVSKTIKGLDYWYYQYKLPTGTPQQIYIGPNDEATRALIATHKDPAAKRVRQHLSDLCESVAALGCYSVIPKHARVLARLADHGLFRAGGVLVGTHAYLAYQNRFGLRWAGGETTVDLDFAHPGKNISIAINEDLKIDGHGAIESLRMGFLPVSAGTRYVKDDEPDFDLDFLTCLHRGGDEPVRMPQLNLSLQPLRFMEFSMQDPTVSVLVASSGPIVTNLPRPERYALAKLLLYPERLDGQQPEKASKDLLQAASLLDYLSRTEADALRQAWADLLARGPTWRKLAKQGFDALQQRHPDIECAIAAPRTTRTSPRPAR